MFYYFIRKLLFLIDPEKAHALALKYFSIKKINYDFFLKLKHHQNKLNVWV